MELICLKSQYFIRFAYQIVLNPDCILIIRNVCYGWFKFRAKEFFIMINFLFLQRQVCMYTHIYKLY